ncbi:CASP-like protein 4A2 isoform X4 [Zingiber officinale]|uniref:CASP-like protein 4A2 isoform X4 n=1 Tax=Zingiber officinale TaxID=94328 RepID=UPI001C4DC8C0|nr:CASP-like protein 4A2 isoform X4 [Zingiber officinale]
MTSPRKSPASPLAPNTLTPGRGDALPPVKGTLGEEPTPESSLALVVNSLDVRKEAETVASDGGIRTRERGFAPTSLERTRRLEETAPPRKKALWLRMAALLLCMISFSVMVTDKTDGWAGDSFHRYKEFRDQRVAPQVLGRGQRDRVRILGVSSLREHPPQAHLEVYYWPSDGLLFRPLDGSDASISFDVCFVRCSLSK